MRPENRPRPGVSKATSNVDCDILVLLPKERKANDAAGFWRTLQKDVPRRRERQEPGKDRETAVGCSPVALGLLGFCPTGLSTQQGLSNKVPPKSRVP